jgi:hypothetical protein
MKVYARIHEPASFAIYRINREFVKRAPEIVEFVDRPTQADFQIVHCLGAGSLTKIWHDRYVLFQHNFLNADITSFPVWLGIFSQALMVVSYADLPSLLKSERVNFHLTPWGVDMDVFRNFARPRTKGVLTTGWCCDGEAIQECYLAAQQCRKEMVNLGDDFRFGGGFSAVSRVTDKELCEIYNDCEFVSGLRFREGFELSVIEGLACGCRPICFDLPVYRKWFEDLVCFVPHCHGPELINRIETVLRECPKQISIGEAEGIKNTFRWQNITDRFWTRIVEYV